MERDGEAEVGGDLAQHVDEQCGHGKAEQRADRRRADVIGHSLREEGFGQVQPAHPDGARHAHLRPSLGSQHDEDEEDQHDAGGDGE